MTGPISNNYGLGLFELIFVNIFMFAGSSQFLLVEFWQKSDDVIKIVTAVLIMNLRYFLAAASLKQLYVGASLRSKLISAHFLVDESWALTIGRLAREPISPVFLVGSGTCLMISWSFGTLVGYNVGTLIQNPEVLALDFAFTAIFTAIVLSLWTDRHQCLLPWLISALVALVTKEIIEGSWYIVVGGIVGALVAIFVNTETSNQERMADDR